MNQTREKSDGTITCTPEGVNLPNEQAILGQWLANGKPNR